MTLCGTLCKIPKIEHTYFFKRGAGDLIFTTCDCYGLNNVVFNFGART